MPVLHYVDLPSAMSPTCAFSSNPLLLAMRYSGGKRSSAGRIHRGASEASDKFPVQEMVQATVSHSYGDDCEVTLLNRNERLLTLGPPPMVRTRPEARAYVSKLRLEELPLAGAGSKITSRPFFVMRIEFYALRTASPVDTNSATHANLVANHVFAHRAYPSSLTFCI